MIRIVICTGLDWGTPPGVAEVRQRVAPGDVVEGMVALGMGKYYTV